MTAPGRFDGGTASSIGRGTLDDAEADLVLATWLFPELAGWLPVLRRLRLELPAVLSAAAQAREHGTDIAAELLAGGIVDEVALYRAISEEAGLGFLETVEPDRLIVSDRDMLMLLGQPSWHAPVKLQERSGDTSFVIAPAGIDPARLRGMVAARSGVARRLRVTTPRILRQALVRRAEPMLQRRAEDDLAERFPHYSAKPVLNAWQGGVCGAALVALPVGLLLDPGGAYTALHYAFSIFFLACVALRFAAVGAARSHLHVPREAELSSDMPVYSILVAMYREAALIPDLLTALDGLVWPRAKLQVLLVCERDDPATIAAIRAARPPPHMEIVEVPPSLPRTKPKALSYALPMARGGLVVVYDAEDTPHPLQLIEAWRRFESSGPDLACLQAPLEISNAGAGMIPRMFAFEYRALFHGLLPWLARRRALLPLGGTSNHFRRSVLDEVGGWDPYNVTEDADLGLRLARFGYRTETLSCPTLEPAPTDMKTWLPQRTRWLKGWLQTWFVHMRSPRRLFRDLGPVSFIMAQILFAGMVASAIVHPLLIVTALFVLAGLLLEGRFGIANSDLLIIDLINIGCGYLSFLILGFQTLSRPEREGFGRTAALTPVYWMMVSLAAWRAVWELSLRPHHWSKTEHPPQKTAAPAIA